MSITTLGAFKHSRVSTGVILNEPMLRALEGVEGKGSPPTRTTPVSYEHPATKLQNNLLNKG